MKKLLCLFWYLMAALLFMGAAVTDESELITYGFNALIVAALFELNANR